MDQLERTAADLADVASGLRPADLDQGLDVALAALVEAAPVPVVLRGRLGALPPEVELTIWYLCAEALSNTAKHAPQARVSIRLERTTGCVRVSVEDDGPGGAVLSPGGGLIGLRDRVESLGGRLTLHLGGSGTRLVADLPLGDKS
jgi:signal transduction histidine kinase